MDAGVRQWLSSLKWLGGRKLVSTAKRHEFFATGVQEVDEVMRRAARWGLPVSRRKALDFGCRLGRVSQPLADYFEKVHGADISPNSDMARTAVLEGISARVGSRWIVGVPIA